MTRWNSGACLHSSSLSLYHRRNASVLCSSRPSSPSSARAGILVAAARVAITAPHIRGSLPQSAFRRGRTAEPLQSRPLDGCPLRRARETGRMSAGGAAQDRLLTGQRLAGRSLDLDFDEFPGRSEAGEVHDLVV